MKYFPLLLLMLTVSFPGLLNDPPDWDFDAQLTYYFAAETERIKRNTEAELAQIEDWSAFKEQARAELQDMLGLTPWPGKTSLEATITGTAEHDEFTVQNLHFQSMPGLYVTGNLYIPKNLNKKVPAIIYVCGHATVKKDGYNYGAKVNYQHHPAWFARNGYVCLILDTVQLGEIEGTHHGLHYFDRWWWLSRGYTPAGVEAWNGIRAIDYLLSRPEVDPEKIGITGRSGGGVTSWWVTALDDRIKVSVPVAGITDMEDHVVNGCVEDHCDCMYMFNTYRWDFPKVAALAAPRPLLISNTDRDIMFPVDGVFRVYRQVRQLYEKSGKGDQIALNITAGGHRDEQELRVHAFRWLNRHLYERDGLIEKTAVKFFEPEQLRVFDQLPEDAINARIDETFNRVAPDLGAVLERSSWETAKTQWRDGLTRVFDHWPTISTFPGMEIQANYASPDALLTTFALQTDEHTRLPVFHLRPKTTGDQQNTRVVVLDENNWPLWAARLAAVFPDRAFWRGLPVDEAAGAALREELDSLGAVFLVSTRGAGPAKYSGDDFKQDQIRKRYYLLGQSLQSMQTWDLRQAIGAVRRTQKASGMEAIQVDADGVHAGMALYASLFLDDSLSLRLTDLPVSHMDGPFYPKILRYLDIPAAVLMVAEKHKVELAFHDPDQKMLWEKEIKLAGSFPDLSLPTLLE